MLIFVAVFSCKSIHLNSKGNTDTIMIGRVSMNFIDTLKYNNHVFKGLNYDNIRLRIKHLPSGNTTEFLSDSDGFIKYLNPAEGIFVLENIKFSDKKSGSALLYTVTINQQFRLNKTPEKKVFTPGHLQIAYINGEFVCLQNQNILNFINEFEKIYPKSDWHNYAWEHCPWY